MTVAKKKKTLPVPTFEDAVAALESVTDSLERGDLTLEQSLRYFEDGVRLIRCCDGYLKDAKGRLLELSEGEGGEFITEILGESLESFTVRAADTGLDNASGGDDEGDDYYG